MPVSDNRMSWIFYLRGRNEQDIGANYMMHSFNICIPVNKKVQLDATICRHLFTAKSLYMFRGSQHPSSVALKTVTAASGIGHNTGTATSFQRGRLRTILSRPRWKQVAVPVLWPIPEAAVTVFSAPDDGCCDARNMQSDFAVNKCLHIVASIWTFLLTLNHDAWNHELKKNPL